MLTTKDIYKILKEFGTVEKYDQFKKEPSIIENAQPIDFVSFYYSTLNNEIESNELEETSQELASFMNLPDARPDETFVQLNVIDCGDSTNATAFYISDINSKKELMLLVNEALELDQVTHSSGLQPRYQFI